MDANYGGIDHLQPTIMGLGDGIHEAVPNTCFAPSDKAIVAGGAWAVRSGRSRHGAPDRSTQKMPFSTRRSSTRGTPRGSLGRSGSITRHSKSVRSYRLMHMLNQISRAPPIPFMSSRQPQGTNQARRGSRRRAAAIVFRYDHGHMFCALDDVFAKFVTAIT